MAIHWLVLTIFATFQLGANTRQIRYDDSLVGNKFSSQQNYGNFLTITAFPEPFSLLSLGMIARCSVAETPSKIAVLVFDRWKNRKLRTDL